MQNDDHEIMQEMYHRCVAETQDLREQIKEKEEVWDEKEREYKKTDDLIRKLCEDILAKDQEEMRLGEEYSWSHVPVNDLIKRARKTFIEYNEERTRLLNKVLDISEERREEIENLENQIERMYNQGITKKEKHTSIEEIKEEIADEKRQKDAVSRITDKGVREAAMNGSIDAVITEDKDSLVELDLVNQLIEDSGMQVPMENSIPVTPQREIANTIRKKKQEKKRKSYRINLEDYEKKMTPISWRVMELIGMDGLSVYSQIEEAMIIESNGDITKSRLRMIVRGLSSMGLLRDEKVNIPLKPKMMVHYLTDMGNALFETKYEKAPVISEAERIIAEHDNLTHGYGIKTLSDLIRGFNIYQEVFDYNRKNPIKLSDGNVYIPDIIGSYGKQKYYFEYERGHHTQTDFNRKCNKMAKVSRFLNFIVPNKEVMERLMKQVEAWIKSRGIHTLKNVKIRITTVPALKSLDGTKDINLRNDKTWQVVYDLNKGDSPISKV